MIDIESQMTHYKTMADLLTGQCLYEGDKINIMDKPKWTLQFRIM